MKRRVLNKLKYKQTIVN